MNYLCIYCICWAILKFLLNAIIISIITGVIAAGVYEKLVAFRKSEYFRKHLKHLCSSSNENFDWICHNILTSNGRLVDPEPNGSKVNVKHIEGNKLKITLKQSDDRVWEGDLIMNTTSSGTLFSKYIDEHEYRFMNVYIGVEEANNLKYDYIFTIPYNDDLFYLQQEDKGKILPKYNYGREIFRRKIN